uniref:Uncharacterized protein n=1 Tax=Podarcis muralis TaxID=64176 RepID=A0A670I2Z0_PODMU
MLSLSPLCVWLSLRFPVGPPEYLLAETGANLCNNLHFLMLNAKLQRHNDINAVNSEDETLLHIAAAHGHTEIIDYLIGRGAKLEVKDKKGRTPLHRAAERGHGEAVKMLLQLGANMYTLDQEGKSPLHLAHQNHHTHVLKSILKEEVRRHKNQHNFLHMATALGYAVSRGFEKTKKTPLHLAAMGGHLNAVKALLAKKSRFGAKDMDGCTSMHYAAINGNVEILQALLAAGKNKNIDDKNIWRKTPLHLAAEHGHSDLIHFFLSNVQADK